MNHKGKFIQRVGSFLSGRSFYIVLLLCVATVGVSGYYLYRVSASFSADELEPVSAATQITVPVPEQTKPPEEADPPEETAPPAQPEPEEEETPPAPVSETVETAAPTEETPIPVTSLVSPLSGEVMAAFSADTLTYNEAMGDWRTHGGVDISADLGAEVSAAGPGCVTAVFEDPYLGTAITVRHPGDLETVYGNLDPDTLTVTEGEEVVTGQIIGCVGSSAIGERHQGAWLHFGVTRNGVAIDPEPLLE